jgi:2'-hydroxyisoflavone reductase
MHKETLRPLSPLRILFLGGTGYIGPPHVQVATARGHEVSVFNRGNLNSVLPVDVERLLGDRVHDFTSIMGRDWDAVVDLATYDPASIRRLGMAMKDRVGHYTFVSTIATYDLSAAIVPVDERSRLKAYAGKEDPFSQTIKVAENYGSLKVLCEREAEGQFPSKTLILRPGYISGPGDAQGFLNYWAMRMMHGGDMIVAGKPAAPVQFIDVRDLAEWAVRMIEKRVTGIFNVVGPDRGASLGDLIGAAAHVARRSPSVTWVEPAWLAGHGRDCWQKILFWTELDRDKYGPMPVDIEKALGQGLVTRPLHATVADTLDWYQTHSAGIRGSVLASTTWESYLQREQQILSAWRLASGHSTGAWRP